MTKARQESMSLKLGTRKERARLACFRDTALGAIFLFSMAFVPFRTGAVEPYTSVIEDHLALEKTALLDAETETEENPGVADLRSAVSTEVAMLPEQHQVDIPPPEGQRSAVALTVISPLAAILSIAVIGYLLKRWLDRWASGPTAEERIAALLAEDSTMPAELRELRNALDPKSGEARPGKDANPNDTKDPFEVFYATVANHLENLRSLLSELNQIKDEVARQPVLNTFRNRVSELREISRPAALRPVWLITSALDGLMRQVTRDPNELTESVLRTVADSLDLLGTLSARGSNPNLASNPPVKLLAVDDDAVSRLALSFSLKNAFNAPDLAPDGETALQFISEQTYDVIFLDVDMPAMNGYELCERIRQNGAHRATPVVFVTRHTDFNSRAQSALSGGQGLIGKPFLTFEITLKALTLALRGRLIKQASARAHDRDIRESGTQLMVIAGSESTVAANAAGPGMGMHNTSDTTRAGQPQDSDRLNKVMQSSRSDKTEGPSFPASGVTPLFAGLNSAPIEPQVEKIFFERAGIHLDSICEVMRATSVAPDSSVCAHNLAEIYVQLCSLAPEVTISTAVHPALRLNAAVSGLIKKLLERPQERRASVFHTAAGALELLRELCELNGRVQLPACSSFRMLVVDDDLISRRAIGCALQMIFHKPHCVENGEAALAAAEVKAYDVIFLDVQMPGMDGFEVCSRLRRSERNCDVPIVFVTRCDDVMAREKAARCGGNDFIQKPFLTSEVAVKALTFALRTRLSKLQLA